MVHDRSLIQNVTINQNSINVAPHIDDRLDSSKQVETIAALVTQIEVMHGIILDRQQAACRAATQRVFFFLASPMIKSRLRHMYVAQTEVMPGMTTDRQLAAFRAATQKVFFLLATTMIWEARRETTVTQSEMVHWRSPTENGRLYLK